MFQLRFIFLNKVSCSFTKRRYLILSKISVIRLTINVCVISPVPNSRRSSPSPDHLSKYSAGLLYQHSQARLTIITPAGLSATKQKVSFAKFDPQQVASVCASDIRNKISKGGEGGEKAGCWLDVFVSLQFPAGFVGNLTPRGVGLTA